MVEWGAVSPFRDKSEKSSSKPVKWSTCPVLSLLLHLMFSKIAKIGLSVHKVLSHETKSCNLRKHLRFGGICYISSTIRKKNPVCD